MLTSVIFDSLDSVELLPTLGRRRKYINEHHSVPTSKIGVILRNALGKSLVEPLRDFDERGGVGDVGVIVMAGEGAPGWICLRKILGGNG